MNESRFSLSIFSSQRVTKATMRVNYESKRSEALVVFIMCIMVVYFRSATGENWQQIMMTCTSANCDPRSESTQSDCGTFVAYIYFVAFYMICSFLVGTVI